LISQLPTIFHIKYGVWRTFGPGSRKIEDLLYLIEQEQWKRLEPIIWFLPYGNSRLPFQDPLYVWTLPQDFNWRVQFSPICVFCCPLYSRPPGLFTFCPLFSLRFGTSAPFKATICLCCLVIVSISTVVIFRRNHSKTIWPFCLLNPRKHWFQLHQNYAWSCHLQPKSDPHLNIE